MDGWTDGRTDRQLLPACLPSAAGVRLSVVSCIEPALSPLLENDIFITLALLITKIQDMCAIYCFEGKQTFTNERIITNIVR